MRTLSKILSIIYTIILTITILILSIGIVCTSFFKAPFYTKVLNNVDVNKIKGNDIGISDNRTLEDILIDSFEDIGIENKVAKTILETDEINTIAGNAISKIINNKITNENIPIVTNEDVKTVLNNNEVKEVLNEEFTEKDINNIVSEINKYIKENYSKGDKNE